jgi:hypothetical protein
VFFLNNTFRSSCLTHVHLFVSAHRISLISQSFFSLWRCGPTWPRVSSFLRFIDHTQTETPGRAPLDECSDRRWDLYLTTHNTHNRQTSIPPAGFEYTISAGAANGIGTSQSYPLRITYNVDVILWW